MEWYWFQLLMLLDGSLIQKERRGKKMKLYRIECHRDSNLTVTTWTTNIETAKQNYEKVKAAWYDDEAYEDDTIQLVEIDVPEEVLEEFEDEPKILQEEVICIDPDNEDEDGYVSSYWHMKIGNKVRKDEL